MNPATIRRIDITIGRIVCFLLTCLRQITEAFRKEPQRRGVRKILFIKLIEQGATVLAYSAIKNAVEMVGTKNVYFCVFKENREILDIMDIIPPDNIFAIRHNNILIFLKDVMHLIYKVRQLKIEATIDMEFFTRAPAILAYLTGANYRVGLHRFTSEVPYRGDLMTHRIQYNPYIHTAQAYYLLVEALKMEPSEIPMLKIPIDKIIPEAPKFQPEKEEVAYVIQLLEMGSSLQTGKIAILNPNASDMLPLRKWPLDNFISLGKQLLDSYDDLILVITGAPSERQYAIDLCTKLNSDRVINVAGKTTLRQLLVLYSISDVLITNDSGPAHFASMTDIDAVVLFGPETPSLFGALGSRFHPIYNKLACSPCVNVFNHRFSPCSNNICMRLIDEDVVLNAINRCLLERSRRTT
jgi:ADP-heptose:LPS heptosyltransferase